MKNNKVMSKEKIKQIKNTIFNVFTPVSDFVGEENSISMDDIYQLLLKEKLFPKKIESNPIVRQFYRKWLLDLIYHTIMNNKCKAYYRKGLISLRVANKDRLFFIDNYQEQKKKDIQVANDLKHKSLVHLSRRESNKNFLEIAGKTNEAKKFINNSDELKLISMD